MKIILGRSLSNVQLTPGNSAESIYLLPFCTNFPSHDSSVFMKASEIYVPSASPSTQAHAEVAAELAASYVLVGFQMAVSGSGKYEDNLHIR